MAKRKKEDKETKKVPLGVKLSSIISFVVGIGLLIITILIMIKGNEFVDPFAGLLAIIIILIGLPTSILLIVTSIGLWKLKKWARILAIVIGVLLFLRLIEELRILVGLKFNLRSSVFGTNSLIILLIMILFIIISLYLLFSKKVKKAFS